MITPISGAGIDVRIARRLRAAGGALDGAADARRMAAPRTSYLRGEGISEPDAMPRGRALQNEADSENLMPFLVGRIPTRAGIGTGVQCSSSL
jgi:hypothetical protein